MDRATLSDDAVRRWIAGWARGWRDHDTRPIAELYADDAVFVSEPFRSPQRGGAGAAEYAAWAFADEEAVELWFAQPIVEGERAAVPYWAIIEDAEGRTATLAGVATLWFDGDGNVVQQRDYWNMAADTTEPPPDGWGDAAAHERRA